MLDLNHPDTPYIFAISSEDDALLSIVKRMTLVSTSEKMLLLQRATDHLQAMREITLGYWGSSQSRIEAIDLLASQIETLSAIESQNDFVSDWQGKVCTVCDDRIHNLEQWRDMLYCPTCIKLVDEGRQAVSNAFGLWCI